MGLIRFTVELFSLKTLRLFVAYTEIPEVWNSGAHSAERLDRVVGKSWVYNSTAPKR